MGVLFMVCNVVGYADMHYWRELLYTRVTDTPENRAYPIGMRDLKKDTIWNGTISM